jgi:quinoprotein glucose dehydrogenase
VGRTQRKLYRYLLGATLLGFFPAKTLLVAQNDWSSVNQSSNGQRHSALTEINTKNVSGLEQAWSFELDKDAIAGQGEPDSAGRAPAANGTARPVTIESVPLVVNGVMYVSWPHCHVAALDADNGTKLWQFTSPVCVFRGNLSSMRSVAYWAGDNEISPRIIFGTEDGELRSLDAKTGQPVASFGVDGVVNLKTPEIMNGYPAMHYGMTSPPFIYKDLIITGSHIVDETGRQGPAGDVRAWDARTGKLKWTFHTIPRPGEPGHETWKGDSWKGQSGANTWTFFTADVERGLLFMPLGSVNNDFYGVDRPGNNLYSDTLVAVDANTGKMRWHFQTIHHDLWDYDLPAPPMLFDVVHGSERIPAVAAMSKNAILFILNRETGKPIYGVEERKVPAGHLAGEWYSPTQPFPLKPPPLVRQSFTTDEFAKISPEHEAACRNWYADFLKRGGTPNQGPYTPPSPEGALKFPTQQGGSWAWGGTFDPEHGYYIVNTTDSGGLGFIWLDKAPTSSSIYNNYPDSLITYSNRPSPEVRAQISSPAALAFASDGMPCWAPPWGSLIAVDVNTGDIAWRIPYGVTPNTPPGLDTGGPNALGGPTTTAGGLVFMAGSRDNLLSAYATSNGSKLWSYKLDDSPSDVPIAYAGENGKEYVAVVAGDKVVAFRLSEHSTVAGTNGAQNNSTATQAGAVESEPGQQSDLAVVQKVCTTCHSISVVTATHRSDQEWSDVLDKMAQYGASASDEQFKMIRRYLTTNLGTGK